MPTTYPAAFAPESLFAFGARIQRLIDGHSLSRLEAREAFLEILEARQPDLQQGAFLAALVAKGETHEEIAGAWEAIYEADTFRATLPEELEVVENSGTGMDSLKTFNVSSAAAVVAAACGVPMARHGARGITSRCGTVDLLEAAGLQVECSVEEVCHSVVQVGLGLFNGMSPQVHPGALGRILSQIRFGSTLNLAASLANPVRPRLGVRGVYAPRLLPVAAGVMREIGYRRGWVVCGTCREVEGFMDEISPCGETQILRWEEDGDLITETFHPEDLGITAVPWSEIASTGNVHREAERFLAVLHGRGSLACTDFTCLNAAALLVVARRCRTLTEGLTLAREALAAGAVAEKWRHWVDTQGK